MWFQVPAVTLEKIGRFRRYGHYFQGGGRFLKQASIPPPYFPRRFQAASVTTGTRLSGIIPFSYLFLTYAGLAKVLKQYPIQRLPTTVSRY